jgi:predicted phosphodiesterase
LLFIIFVVVFFKQMKTNLLFLTFFLALSALVVAAEPIVITHGPYLQNLACDEVTIVWTTNNVAVSWVELAPDDNSDFYFTERPKFFASKNGIKLENVVHAVKVRGLKPATRYRYRILSQEVREHRSWHVYYGDIAASDVYNKEPLSFVTLSDNSKELHFSMFNDIHGRSNVLEKMFGVVNPQQQDMVFFNGDMVSLMNNAEDLFTGFMDVSVKAFASTTPMYYSRGNHETRGSFASSFQNYFSPLNPELYFLVRNGPVCFVVLDCGEDKPDSDLEYCNITDYDAYRSQQAEWLRQALKDKRFTEAKFKVAVCHIPPTNNGWHGEAEIYNKFVPLLNDADVDVMLSGHYHRTLKWNANENVKFPTLINSNNSVLKGTVDGNTLTLDVIDLEGKRTEGLIIVK